MLKQLDKHIVTIFISSLFCLSSSVLYANYKTDLMSELSDVLKCPPEMVRINFYSPDSDYIKASCGNQKYRCEEDEIIDERKLDGAVWEETITKGPMECWPID